MGRSQEASLFRSRGDLGAVALGTTHLTVETILQGEGWDKGWASLLEIGGNLAQVSDRSFGVPDAVNSGQYGVGIVIDFFGLSARRRASRSISSTRR